MTIENVFDPSQFDADASLILECSNRLREKCLKLGTVRKVVVYDTHRDSWTLVDPKKLCTLVDPKFLVFVSTKVHKWFFSHFAKASGL